MFIEFICALVHCHAGRWMASFLSMDCFIPSNNLYCNTSKFFLSWVLLRKQQIFQNLQAQWLCKTRTMLKLNIFKQNVLCYCSYHFFQKFSSFYFHFDNEMWHSSLIQRSCTLKFSTITRSSTHNSLMFATSIILFTLVSILKVSWQLCRS